MVPIKEFSGGNPETRAHLNEIVHVCNALINVRGGGIVTARFVPGVGFQISATVPNFTPGGSSVLPKGQYQDMMFGMVSDNQTGFYYDRAHSMT